MTTALIMGIIGGIFCTLFINTFFIKRFFQGIRLMMEKTPPDENGTASEPKKKFDFEFYNAKDAGTFVIIQIIFFLIGAGILTCWYYFGAADRTVSKFIATAWFIGVVHIVNWLITQLVQENNEIFTSRYCDLPEGMTKCAALFSIGIFVFSIGFNIAGGIYNYSHQQETTTFIQEEAVPIISVDTLKTLESEVLIDGYELGDAINRNGKVVIPMSREGNVSYAGYVVIEDNQPSIVPKTLSYTPDHSSTNNTSMVARSKMPTKIFFGNWSFQLKPNGNGEDDVYYVCAYGHYRWLRAGRVIEGLAFVNAETGEFTTCTIEEVPNWINGISQ